jgi:hypothetical protein
MEHRSKGLPGRARTARGADSPPRITAWLYYIDTLRVAFRAPLSPAEGRELVRLNRIPWQRANLITYGTRYRYAIVLSPMPQPEALRFLASIQPDHRISRLHVAADRITITAADAERLQHEDYLHLIQAGRRGRRRARECHGTLYSGPRRTARNIAGYADRLSKIVGRPCDHQELRFEGYHESCWKFGTLADIADLDIRELFIQQTRDARFAERRFHRLMDQVIETQMRRGGHDRATTFRGLQGYICHGLLQSDSYPTPRLTDPSTIPAQRWIDCIPLLVGLSDGISPDRFRAVLTSTNTHHLWHHPYDYIGIAPVSHLAP